MIKILSIGKGKRKKACAKIFLRDYNGINTINKLPLADYFRVFKNKEEILIIDAPFRLLNILDEFSFDGFVTGGGLLAQLDALRLALANALIKYQAGFRPLLKKEGFLRSDARHKERRKYGLKKARKAPQYSKR